LGLSSGGNIFGAGKAAAVVEESGGESAWSFELSSGKVPRRLATALTEAGQRTVRLLGPGDAFGEAALLVDAPRSASVVAASSELELLSLDRTSYFELLTGAHSLASATYAKVGFQSPRAPFIIWNYAA
jgi:CRP-like cAMP-binding protein